MGEKMENHLEYQTELDYFRHVLLKLVDYQGKMLSQKEMVDKSVAYSRKHFNSDNAEQFTDLVINASRQEWLSQRLLLSRRSLLKPYFARVDFTSDDEKKLEKLYIGKMSLIRDEDDYPLIIDWRAPVSNLYYEGRLGGASYDSPDGLITGEISLKRQYIIEKGAINDFFDIDVTASDEFLQIALGSSKDKRLKDIVSTIQAEQNRVIRADMLRPLVVQGAAGGGKTTIALHRIAYLLYNYESRLSAKNIMIIAPNRFFISYISEVLPDLGVENVFQTTFTDFAAEFLDTKIKIKPVNSKLGYMLANPAYIQTIAGISRFKSSLSYKKVIDNYLNYIIENLLPPDDFLLDKFCLFKRSELYKLLLKDYHFLPIKKRIFELRKYLKNALSAKKPRILGGINSDFDFRVSLIKEKYPEDCEDRRRIITAVLNERDVIINRLEKKSKTLIADYLKPSKLKNAAAYYKVFLGNRDLFSNLSKGLWNERNIESLRLTSLKVLNEGFFEEEDLAPLMHIHFALNGNEYFDLRHIVIDEAQDISLFQLFCLKEIMKSDSFTILGDLCQGIYSYKGIEDWSKVSSQIFNNRAIYHTLEQSYRTTVEIMDFANVVMSKLMIDVPRAKPVIRHGSPVVLKGLDNIKELAAEIKKALEDYKKHACKSIAVICKTNDESLELYNLMKPNFKELNLLTGKEKEYLGGAVILPAYLSKGLEFDGVIIANASEERYGLTDLDIKMLYIGMTRALHRLQVYYIKTPSALLLSQGNAD